MTLIEPTADHAKARDEIVEALRKYEGLGALHLLAIAAQVVGQLVALQDQNKVSPAQAMRLVEENIVIGNQNAIDELRNAKAVGHA
jgi:hypothetical protein